jgi:hypothetical protein
MSAWFPANLSLLAEVDFLTSFLEDTQVWGAASPMQSPRSPRFDTLKIDAPPAAQPAQLQPAAPAALPATLGDASPKSRRRAASPDRRKSLRGAYAGQSGEPLTQNRSRRRRCASTDTFAQNLLRRCVRGRGTPPTTQRNRHQRQRQSWMVRTRSRFKRAADLVR